MSVRLEIEGAEERLRRAMLASDVALLEDLLSDACVFTNQDGMRLSKADDLTAHRSSLLEIDRLEVRDEPIIRILGNSAIVCVTTELAGAYDGEAFGGVFAYTRLWHRTDGRWRVEAAHCSSAAGV